MRQTLWQAALGVSLVALLVVLGTLQYRWLGDVSNAERDRLRATLRTRASDFSREFDRTITRLYVAFHVEGDDFDRDAAARLSAAFKRAQQAPASPGLVKDVFLVEARGALPAALQRVDPDQGSLTPVEWPAAFDGWKRRAEHVAPPAPGFLPPFFMADAVDAATPALIIPVPSMTRLAQGGRIALIPDPRGVSKTIIVWLDADRLRAFVEALVVKHFGSAEDSEYYVTIANRDAEGAIVYSSTAGVTVTAKDADVALGVFDLSLDELNVFTAHVPPPSGGGATSVAAEDKNRVAITIVRRSTGPDGPRGLIAGGDNHGAWQILVRSKRGSLDALVARSRYRNLAIGLGVLGLLAVGFVFVIGSALRQQRLARQQIEFVAAVSHELRTPLAVIRSAAENLADGVVGDGAQVRRYGSLIRSEGIRLSDMVERVMEYAGIHANRLRARSEVNVSRLIADAVAALAADARTAIRVDAGAATTCPGRRHAEALRAAIHNIVGNAIRSAPADRPWWCAPNPRTIVCGS